MERLISVSYVLRTPVFSKVSPRVQRITWIRKRKDSVEFTDETYKTMSRRGDGIDTEFVWVYTEVGVEVFHVRNHSRCTMIKTFVYLTSVLIKVDPNLRGRHLCTDEGGSKSTFTTSLDDVPVFWR